MIDNQFYDQYLSTGQISTVHKLPDENLYAQFIYDKYFSHVYKQDVIIDLACGYGEIIYFLQQKEFENAKGVEISNELVLLAEKLGVKNVSEGEIIDYVKRLDDCSVKVFILKDIIEHLDTETLVDLLKILKQKLCINGFIVGHAPNAAGIFGMIIRYGDITHKSAFTKKSIEQMSKLVGLNNVEVIEDKILTKGFKGLLRRYMYKLLVYPFKFLYYIESGNKDVVFTQNLTFKLSH